MDALHFYVLFFSCVLLQLLEVLQRTIYHSVCDTEVLSQEDMEVFLLILVLMAGVM